MSLSQYKKKRNFSETPEPGAKEKSSETGLRFVIQKHDASHLHYDFRLELRGVLKSWAVPKGPSINPADKRLAMEVEDHPYDYRDFEGIIPAGNYGGGTVIVWDEGTYEPEGMEKMSRAEQEKALTQQYHAGGMKIVLHGKKIKGSYGLHRIKNEEKPSWLLMKHKDKYAKEEEITKKDKSVKSGKTIAQVAKEAGTVPNHPEENKAPKAAKKAAKKAAPAKATTKKAAIKSSKKKAFNITELLGTSHNYVPLTPIPKDIKPMLSTLVDEPFSSHDWLYEIKWDGYRAVAYIHQGDVELSSRNLNSFAKTYTPVTNALKELSFSAVLDGEVVAINDKGVPDFQALQNWQNAPVALQYYVFDILWVNGYDLTDLPLVKRKEVLQKLLPAGNEVIKYSDHIVGDGENFYKVAAKQGLEGIMAKKADSTYQINGRSKAWLKIKVTHRQEVVIGGYTEPRNSRSHFGALLLGVYEGSELIYVGHTGSGFNTKSLSEVYKKLQALETATCPFSKKPKTNMPVTWVKPKMICEIKFSEWTKEGVARHPIFMGLRTDKKPTDVHMELTTNTEEMVKKAEDKKATPKKAAKAAPAKIAAVSTPKKAATKTATKSVKTKSAGKIKTEEVQLSLEGGTDQLITLDGQELKLTHLDKVYWPKEGIQKIELINCYLRMSPYILPYLQHRPESLNRFPNGINGQNFYQKDMKGKAPSWIETHTDFSESTNKHIDYLVCNNQATLVYLANLGCIELHPWHSRVQTWQCPDWCLIDLDPEGIGFDKVIECAHVVKKVLDSIGAPSYVKTSGSTGLHILIPLGAKYTYDQSRQLAEVIVTLVNAEIPSYTSLERSPAKRPNKIYLDYLQNRQTQTAAAPYSLRPKPGAPVSTPLRWEEVKKGLTPTTYHMYNILDRVQSEGDLLNGILSEGIDLEKVLENIDKL